mmetsp:Transcript_21016/g.58448  ORF Transcript_21016/g.58448 Transcript_21016/m.58448 type:complete len:216 (-) Transcript_21016:559-1206(-)
MPVPLEVSGFSVGRKTNLCNCTTICKGSAKRFFVDIPGQVSNKYRAATLWFLGCIAWCQNWLRRRVLDRQPTALKVSPVQFQSSSCRGSIVKVKNSGSRTPSIILQRQFNRLRTSSTLRKVFLYCFLGGSPRQSSNIQFRAGSVTVCNCLFLDGRFECLFVVSLSLLRRILGRFRRWGILRVAIGVRTAAAIVAGFLLDIHLCLIFFVLIVGVAV